MSLVVASGSYSSSTTSLIFKESGFTTSAYIERPIQVGRNINQKANYSSTNTRISTFSNIDSNVIYMKEYLDNVESRLDEEIHIKPRIRKSIDVKVNITYGGKLKTKFYFDEDI